MFWTKTTSVWVLSLLLTFIGVDTAPAQEAKDTRVDEVLSLVKFYEYMLNILGSASSSQRDKQVIINESFNKAFSSNQVQVEDDLLDDRKVVLNKNIQGYLRDVDFFFQEIKFRFDSIQIERMTGPDQENYYLVTFEKSCEGQTLHGKPFNKIQKRFLEVNINDENSDIKIASAYTSKISLEEEMMQWYRSLSFGWIHVFEKYIPHDSITSEVLQKLMSLDSMDLSQNPYLKNMEPLGALRELKYLNISNTEINDLSSVRYATKLHTIIANNSAISDLSVFPYFKEIRNVELRNTPVTDISPLISLSDLKSLDLSSTPIVNFESIGELEGLHWLDLSNTAFSSLQLLSKLSQLESLNLSYSKVENLQGFASLSKIHYLNISGTDVSKLDGIANHTSLRVIDIGQTPIALLSPLNDIPTLEKVEADLTNISESEAGSFMELHPQVTVIIKSKELKKWWEELPVPLKDHFQSYVRFEQPSKENLIRVTKIDSLDISQIHVENLPHALSQLRRLTYLNVSNTSPRSLDFLKEKPRLKTFIATACNISEIQGIEMCSELVKVDLSDNPISHIRPLYQLKNLKYIAIENTQTPDNEVIEYIKSNKEATVIWRSDLLQLWWMGLSKEWQEAFGLQNPNKEELHQLTQGEKLEIRNSNIVDFEGIIHFVNLKELHLEQVGILNFNGLSVHKSLTSITCVNGPLQSAEGLQGLTQLTELNVSNTAISDLRNLVQTSSIQKLNCSGTNIKKLKGIEGIRSLEFIDISNTGVFKLDDLYDLLAPKEIVCFNTRLRKSEIDHFKKAFPDCKVVYY